MGVKSMVWGVGTRFVMEMFWRRRAGAGLLRCRKARVRDGSARTRILCPFLPSAQASTANHCARPPWAEMNAMESLATASCPLLNQVRVLHATCRAFSRITSTRSCGAPGVFVPWFTREHARTGKVMVGLARSLAFWGLFIAAVF
jgi:hypothetical protein